MSRRDRRTRSQRAKSEPFTLHSGASPDGAGHRQHRLEHILLLELQSLLSDEASDPSLAGIVLLSVHLSPDAGHARIAYAVRASLSQEHAVGQASRRGLLRATAFLRARLAEQLSLKKLPQLGFTFVGIAQEGAAP